jgi:hypothetical protein
VRAASSSRSSAPASWTWVAPDQPYFVLEGNVCAYRLDLASSTEFSNGTVGLHYRRHR